MRASPVVADASVVLKWFIEEDYSKHARMLRDDHLYGRVTVHAPSTLMVEVANALRKYVARSVLTREQALRGLRVLYEAGIELEEVGSELLLEALGYSIDNNVTVYDALYVALARKLGTTAYTADEKLLGALRGRDDAVAHIQSYTPAR
ncbi:type II toxin-antitoxin system VapC family toxin [Infirmifilum lucidum]|uniref:Type II toxin-antitoxin system VapC family toxin n=1 Tax=Infirmifilum lucidum TaxID=2776706 RepID=A0A7L9FJ33_9CREN|nr:type II toxin-antitoxin system VapC family toxin [Infirmifilum lucidum]QOJ79033.1 type II toxin-antitoxin system VapC family toxin [Infirmifilum lucidum]